MSANELSDPAESLSLTPAESLTEWRREKDEQRYRRWCEESFGMVEVGPEIIHPAEVLDACRADAARRGRDEVRASWRADVEDKVCERFPAPIAVPFNSFLHGSLDPLKRMLHMKDAWEGLIHLLAALTLAECASAGAAFGGFHVRNSEANTPKICSKGDLKTNSLALRIGLIEGALDRAQTLGLPLSMASIISRGLIQEIRRLNAVRNEFSHEAVKSDKQAEEIISDAYPLLREILVDLADLEQVELFRLRTIKLGSPPQAEAERLQGYAQGRRVKELPLDASSSLIAISATPIGTYDRVLASLGGGLVDLSPFFYAFEDVTGRRTHIGFFKFNKDGKWNLEIIGESKSVEDLDTPHEALMARFYDLLKLEDRA
ncbi:hypothetical protein GIW41_15650 [Pseudomonas sp. PA-6-1D]|uniref:hypothetical protein n=1 Tax=Pseudomonas TaxID=286 RepID=UPI001EF1485C|nr:MULTISPECIES: hypothetical protein [Pseudomonas]MCF5144399.1 hypothetical protein [Pseudomonas sp. PA-6-3C]MCF5148721.1 hypothetical protein [Pseudomonas sp. PA-6-3F]MCF5160417.1 hypothetical protein [Pseudomonas sp. PA-6-2E]MCF5176693.1 hypothetical protein [Pseudomonas sp. PA-6-1D]MCF5194270.1 hypothetical protein [Pseudomonas sp. PA-6-1H]